MKKTTKIFAITLIIAGLMISSAVDIPTAEDTTESIEIISPAIINVIAPIPIFFRFIVFHLYFLI